MVICACLRRGWVASLMAMWLMPSLSLPLAAAVGDSELQESRFFWFIKAKWPWNGLEVFDFC